MYSYRAVGQDTNDPLFWYDAGVKMENAVAVMASSRLTGTRLENLGSGSWMSFNRRACLVWTEHQGPDDMERGCPLLLPIAMVAIAFFDRRRPSHRGNNCMLHAARCTQPLGPALGKHDPAQQTSDRPRKGRPPQRRPSGARAIPRRYKGTRTQNRTNLDSPYTAPHPRTPMLILSRNTGNSFFCSSSPGHTFAMTAVIRIRQGSRIMCERPRQQLLNTAASKQHKSSGPRSSTKPRLAVSLLAIRPRQLRRLPRLIPRPVCNILRFCLFSSVYFLQCCNPPLRPFASDANHHSTCCGEHQCLILIHPPNRNQHGYPANEKRTHKVQNDMTNTCR